MLSVLYQVKQSSLVELFVLSAASVLSSDLMHTQLSAAQRHIVHTRTHTNERHSTKIITNTRKNVASIAVNYEGRCRIERERAENNENEFPLSRLN